MTFCPWIGMAAALACAFGLLGCGDDDDASRARAPSADAAMDQTASDAAPKTCTPHDVDGFVPPAYRPALHEPDACGSALRIELMADCLSTSKFDEACVDRWRQGDAAHQTCVSCAVSPGDAARLGAIVVRPGRVQLNAPGCIEIAGDVSCAQKYDAYVACLNAACAPEWCPTPGDHESFQAQLECQWAAAAEQCDAYATEAQCVPYEIDPGSTLGRCMNGTAGDYLNIFCGE